MNGFARSLRKVRSITEDKSRPIVFPFESLPTYSCYIVIIKEAKGSSTLIYLKIIDRAYFSLCITRIGNTYTCSSELIRESCCDILIKQPKISISWF